MKQSLLQSEFLFTFKLCKVFSSLIQNFTLLPIERSNELSNSNEYKFKYINYLHPLNILLISSILDVSKFDISKYCKFEH